MKRPPPLQVQQRGLPMFPSDEPAPPAVLTVSAYKLCKFRRYAVTLSVRKDWRAQHGLRDEQLSDALLNAKCCRFGTTVPVGCTKCKCQPVVTLAAAPTKMPVPNSSDDAYEDYVCNIRSRCSSSRDHLKSPLVLLIDTLPLPVPLVSSPFALLARDKSQPPKRPRLCDSDLAADGGADTAPGRAALPRKTHRRPTKQEHQRQADDSTSIDQLGSMDAHAAAAAAARVPVPAPAAAAVAAAEPSPQCSFGTNSPAAYAGAGVYNVGCLGVLEQQQHAQEALLAPDSPPGR